MKGKIKTLVFQRNVRIFDPFSCLILSIQMNLSFIFFNSFKLWALDFSASFAPIILYETIFYETKKHRTQSGNIILFDSCYRYPDYKVGALCFYLTRSKRIVCSRTNNGFTRCSRLFDL